MLDTVIPSNYEELDFGVDFKKYNEDGLLISEKEKYDKYILKDDEKYGIADTFEFIPSKPVEFIDTDLDANEIKKDENLRELEDALNYDGEEEAYEQLEDDFFIQLIQGEIATKKPKKEEKKKKKKQEQ